MATSAADLQRQHELEGTPDPFPSLNDSPAKPKRTPGAASKVTALDTSSRDAFPSLGTPGGSAPVTPKTVSGWGAGPRIQRQVEKKSVFSESFSLSALDLKTSGKDGKPTTLREVMTTVMNKTGTVVEASTQRMGNQTTFVIRGDSPEDLDCAKRQLTAMLSPMVTRKIDAPVSTIGGIIGTKGATLKQIRDQTNVKIDIPRKGNATLGVSNGNVASASRSPSPGVAPDEDEEEPTVSISVSGAAPMVQEAIGMLQVIIGTRTPKTTQRFRDATEQSFPFLAYRISQYETKVYGRFPDASITISSNEEDREIVVIGDKEAALYAMEGLKIEAAQLEDTLKKVAISIPRANHRLVTGGTATEEFLNEYGVVVIPSKDSEAVDIWGPQEKLGPALTAVLEKSNSRYIKTVDLPKPYLPVVTYLSRTFYTDTVTSTHPEVEVYVTEKDALERGGKGSVDIVGEKAVVDAAAKEVTAFVNKLKDAVKSIDADAVVHKAISRKKEKDLEQIKSTHHVQVFFTPEWAEESSIVLVFDPDTSASVAEKKKQLEQAQSKVLAFVNEIGDVVSVTVPVEKKWHNAVTGKHGATLNAIMGEDNVVSIKAGPDDNFTVRGPKSEVDIAVPALEKAIEDAKNYEVEHSHVLEFIIASDYVGRIVGSGGATINKIRDQLDVKIDFNEVGDEKEWTEKGKKKKATGTKSKVRIQGRKESIEEAKKRIMSQVDKLEDETTEVLKINRQYHKGLIGVGGKYVIRLEDKYGVKITFPRDGQDNGEHGGNKTRETLKADEVHLKGGKKGVALAKAEILEVIEYEKVNNQVLIFSIPTRAVSRVLGKGGATINEIKEKTDATSVDVEKEETSPGLTNITVKGTGKSLKDAKAEILAIADTIEEEVVEVLHIENKYHRSFIGKGGETLREILQKVGGPTDSKAQAGLVHFPRNGEPEDEVQLRGEKTLVKKLKVELEKLAASYRDRIVLGVGVPVAHHRSLIGKGGQHLIDLQNKTGTQIWFPGSRAYGSVDEADNAESLLDVLPEELVKVVGARAACEVAIAELTKSQAVNANRTPRPAQQESLSRDVTVPLKYHHVINQQGNFYRTIRSYGVFVDQSKTPEAPFSPVRPPPNTNGAARIDEEGEESSFEWQVILNYEGAEEEDAIWTLRSRDDAALDSAENILKAAIEHAESATHVGFLTLTDRSVFPRIVGTKGANVQRLRAETGADITVGREDNTIIIVGSEDALEAAKLAILQTAAPRPRKNS